MKVVNNREDVLKEKMVDTHYIGRDWESIYGKWRNEIERTGYKRSDLRQGCWRNGAAPLAQRYVKGSKFRSQSGGVRVQLQGKKFGRS